VYGSLDPVRDTSQKVQIFQILNGNMRIGKKTSYGFAGEVSG
jgi:hypothetical protein